MVLKRSRSSSARSSSSRCPNLRPRRSPRLLAKSALHLLDLPDEALAQIYRHLLMYSKHYTNSFRSLRNGFSLASTCSRLRELFFSSIHTFDATRICPDFNHTPRSCQCQMCGHVCISPARAIVHHAAPNLRVLGIPDVLPTTILASVALKCTNLRQLSFTDDGLFLFAQSPANQNLKNVLKLPLLRTLIIQTPTTELLTELADCQTNLNHVNFYDASEDQIIHLVKLVEHGNHELQSFLVTFGSDSDVAVDIYSPAHANSVEIMNSSPTAHLTPPLIADLFKSTLAHYLRRIPFRCLYVSTLDEDMRYGRCDVSRYRPRHDLIRTSTRPRCTFFHDSTPSMRHFDVQRPICRVAIFNFDPEIRHVNNFNKFIEPPLPFEDLYSIWHNPCGTIRFESENVQQPKIQSISNSSNHQQSKSFSAVRVRTKRESTGPSPLRQGIRAEYVISTLLRRLVTLSCECDLWRFHSLPCLHAIEISPTCINVLLHEPARDRIMRIIRSAGTSLQRVHVPWKLDCICSEKSFGVLCDVLRNVQDVTILDLSMTVVVKAIEKRQMLSILSSTKSLKVLHIGCCTHQRSRRCWSSGPSAASEDGNGRLFGCGAGGMKMCQVECPSNICLPSFIEVVPKLLKMVARECTEICRIGLHVDKHSMDFERKVDAVHTATICSNAMKQVKDFSCSKANVDVSSLRDQLYSWGRWAQKRCGSE